jgi:hypothetical protein
VFLANLAVVENELIPVSDLTPPYLRDRVMGGFQTSVTTADQRFQAANS